jgi:hypothetical protein
LKTRTRGTPSGSFQNWKGGAPPTQVIRNLIIITIVIHNLIIMIIKHMYFNNSNTK